MLAFPAVLPAPKAVVDKIIDMGRADNQTMGHLDILTNRFGGRQIGSDAFATAAARSRRE